MEQTQEVERMSIKPVNSIPYANGKYTEMNERLQRDIVDIIEGRVKCAEIVGHEYPNSTMREHIKDVIRSVAYKQYHVIAYFKCFGIHSCKVNGETHWYVEFNTEQWDLERTKPGK